MRYVVWCSLLLAASCNRPEARRDTVASAAPSATPAPPSASSSASMASPPSAPVDAGAPEVHAWFSLAPKPKCGPGSPQGGTCYVVTLSLHGSVERDIVVAKDQWGQASCTSRAGKSVYCSGASGATSIDLACTPSGSCDVKSVAESDGYCPPPEDCATRTKLTSFTIPPGAKLVYAKQ